MESFDVSQLDLNLMIEYGMSLGGALVVLIIGLIVIGAFSNGLKKVFDGKQFEPTLTSFLLSLFSSLLKVLLFLTVLTMLGVEMTSFIAILGAAGLAVGLALSGTLQNFAGGVLILMLKPFKVGDFIDAQGYMGTVAEIQIFTTILKTPDNKVIIIPNGGLATGSLVNFSKEEKRRVDWTFGIAYGDDYETAKKVLTQFINEDDRILKDPEPFIALSELADSSVNIVVRTWVNAGDYWSVFFAMNERVYKEFGQHGLNIPFPQMDVHVHN